MALACDLARRGVRYRLVDKASEYFAGSCGKGLQPRSLEVLDDLGVIDQVLASGVTHLPSRRYRRDRVVGTWTRTRVGSLRRTPRTPAC